MPYVTADLPVSRLNEVTEVKRKPVSSESGPVIAGRNLQFLLVTVAAMAATYARVAVSPLQETMRTALLLSDNEIGLLQGPALAFPMMITAIPLGLLIDRQSRVRLLSALAVIELIGGLLTALAPNFALLFLARGLVGIAVPATSASVFSLLADLYAPAQRGRASMVVVVGQYAGMSAAFTFGGALLGMSNPGLDGWRWAMLWLNGPLIPVIALMLVMREPSRTEIAIDRPTARESFAELWRHRAVFTPLLIALVMADIAIFGVLTWAAPAFSRKFGLPPERIGAIIGTVLLVSGVVGCVAGGILADLCQRGGGPRRTVSALCTFAIFSIPAGLFAVMPNIAAASALLVVFMTIGGAILVTGVTLLTIVIPNELRGVCLSTLMGVQFLVGVGLAPVTISLLSGAMGGSAMIGKALASICVAVSIVGAGAFAFARRYVPTGVAAR